LRYPRAKANDAFHGQRRHLRSASSPLGPRAFLHHPGDCKKVCPQLDIEDDIRVLPLDEPSDSSLPTVAKDTQVRIDELREEEEFLRSLLQGPPVGQNVVLERLRQDSDACPHEISAAVDVAPSTDDTVDLEWERAASEIEIVRQQAKQALLESSKSGRLRMALAKTKRERARGKHCPGKKTSDVELVRQEAARSLAQAGKSGSLLSEEDTTDAWERLGSSLEMLSARREMQQECPRDHCPKLPLPTSCVSVQDRCLRRHDVAPELGSVCLEVKGMLVDLDRVCSDDLRNALQEFKESRSSRSGNASLDAEEEDPDFYQLEVPSERFGDMSLRVSQSAAERIRPVKAFYADWSVPNSKKHSLSFGGS
jgi:hypothetical protein